jgi:hypothetical protein
VAEIVAPRPFSSVAHTPLSDTVRRNGLFSKELEPFGWGRLAGMRLAEKNHALRMEDS